MPSLCCTSHRIAQLAPRISVVILESERASERARFFGREYFSDS